jgi:hypothetical protein
MLKKVRVSKPSASLRTFSEIWEVLSCYDWSSAAPPSWLEIQPYPGSTNREPPLQIRPPEE